MALLFVHFNCKYLISGAFMNYGFVGSEVISRAIPTVQLILH